MESVKATLPDSVSITGVTVFNDRERTYQVNLSKPRRAALFVDQYSGEITGRYERMAFFSITSLLRLLVISGSNTNIAPEKQITVIIMPKGTDSHRCIL